MELAAQPSEAVALVSLCGVIYDLMNIFNLLSYTEGNFFCLFGISHHFVAKTPLSQCGDPGFDPRSGK